VSDTTELLQGTLDLLILKAVSLGSIGFAFEATPEDR
jgi:hypothetical protein